MPRKSEDPGLDWSMSFNRQRRRGETEGEEVEGNGAVKEMLGVRLRAPVVDGKMNGEYTSERGKKKWNGFGYSQTVIIVEDDGRESTSRKPIRTTNPLPPFLFHIPFPSSIGIFRRQLSGSTWVTPPPFSKPFFKSAAINPVWNQTKAHPLKANPDSTPETEGQATRRLPSDSTSLLRISSS